MTVSGLNSFFATDTTLRIGTTGDGTLLIENAGQASSNKANIGGASSSVGHATVTGAQSVWNNFTDLTVGMNGTLQIDNGGYVATDTGRIAGSSTDQGPRLTSGETKTARTCFPYATRNQIYLN